MRVLESNLHKAGEQHYHVLVGEGDYPTHSTSIDSFDEAVDTFLGLVDMYYPGFFEFTEDEEQVRANLLERAMMSTFEEQYAKATVSIGEFKVAFTDCYGCLFPWTS